MNVNPAGLEKYVIKKVSWKYLWTFVYNSYRDNQNLSFLVHFGAICTSIVVTGDDFGSVKGIYYISEEKSVFSPAKPTYKHIWMDRYIFYYPDGDGWLLGDFMDLSTGAFWYKSKNFFYLL